MINKHKLKVLLNKYKVEIKDGKLLHLKDFIGLNVILDLINGNVFCEVDFEKVCLSDLIIPSDSKVPISFLTEYEVPSLGEMQMFKRKYSKIINFNISDFVYRNAAYTWIILMIQSGMLYEGETIDLTKYKLIDFIHDIRIFDILNGYNNRNKNVKTKLRKKEETHLVIR